MPTFTVLFVCAFFFFFQLKNAKEVLACKLLKIKSVCIFNCCTNWELNFH